MRNTNIFRILLILVIIGAETNKILVNSLKTIMPDISQALLYSFMKNIYCLVNDEIPW